MSDNAQAPTQPAPTKGEVVAMILKQQHEQFVKSDYAERLALAKRLSKNGQPWNNPLHFLQFDNPSIEYSLEELKSLTPPLDRDRLNYEWLNKAKGTAGTLAFNEHGLLSIGKGSGRRKPHMNKHQQSIKSASLRIFRELFTSRAELLQATAAEQKIEYLGIPDAMLPKLGQMAAQLAMKEVKQARRLRSRKARRVQQHSRKVNAGLLTISTSQKTYVNRGGEYGK
jgi:hypothetical protein